MEFIDTIIVGGGPAGSTCARQLKQAGHEVMILDKAQFPRTKLCAGWVTGKVLRDLQVEPQDYPHCILELNIRSHFSFLPFLTGGLPTPEKNYSIRRLEFDSWLLERSGATVRNHSVKSIRQAGDEFIIDEQIRCRHLIGAG